MNFAKHLSEGKFLGRIYPEPPKGLGMTTKDLTLNAHTFLGDSCECHPGSETKDLLLRHTKNNKADSSSLIPQNDIRVVRAPAAADLNFEFCCVKWKPILRP
jgi:hypothetical protein